MIMRFHYREKGHHKGQGENPKSFQRGEINDIQSIRVRMTSDISTAISNLDEQCFPNSEGKGFLMWSSCLTKLSDLQDLKKCISHAFSRKLLQDVFYQRREKEREQRKRKKPRKRKMEGLGKKRMSHEKEANSLQDDGDRSVQDEAVQGARRASNPERRRRPEGSGRGKNTHLLVSNR